MLGVVEPLSVVCWKWRPVPGYRSSFGAEQVNTLRSMVARHYQRPHRFICVTDDASGIDPQVEIVELWDDYKDIPGPHGVSCYRRLRIFSAEAGDFFGPRLVSLDLDVVVTGDLVPLWDRPDDFIIWGNTARNTPYNGSMFLLRSGTRRKVWETFNPETSPAVTRAAGLVGSDQAWISHVLGNEEKRWTEKDGVYSWRVHLRKEMRGKLPSNARVVVFHGREDPWMPSLQAGYSWIAEHYR